MAAILARYAPAVARMQPEVLAWFLEQPFVGVLATLRRDGRPYTVPVWWLHDAGAFWISGTTSRIWCRQLARDPRASLCIESADPVMRHIEVDGRCARLSPPGFDIWPISRRLVEKYVGRGERANADAVEAFFANMQTEPRILFPLDPDVWRAIDLTVYRGKRADREHRARMRAAE
jgi:PPOX class probable F420-dependent enzyme